MNESDEFLAALRASGDEQRTEEIAAVGAYEQRPKQVRRLALVEYHCRARSCLLLVVWPTPGRLMFYQPAYKLSRSWNATKSVEAARRRHTRDGDRHWNSRGGVLDRLRSWGHDAGLELQCDHARELALAPQIFVDAAAATPGAPTRRTF